MIEAKYLKPSHVNEDYSKFIDKKVAEILNNLISEGISTSMMGSILNKSIKYLDRLIPSNKIEGELKRFVIESADPKD